MTRFLLLDHPSGLLALDASRVRRLVARPMLVGLAGAAPWVLGAFRLGEAVFPVVDLDLRWAGIPSPPSLRDQFVLTESAALRAGEPRDLVEGRLEPVPPDWALLPQARALLQGLVLFPGGVAAALDLDRILEIPEPLDSCGPRMTEGWSDEELRILEERASACAEEMAHSEATPSRVLALLVLDGERYAAEILEVREFLPLGQVVAVPGAPPAVKGLTLLRGRLVPVLDLGVLLGKELRERKQAIRLVHPEAILAVDRIEEVREVQEAAIRPLGAAPGLGRWKVELPEGPAILLDLAGLAQTRQEGRGTLGGVS